MEPRDPIEDIVDATEGQRIPEKWIGHEIQFVSTRADASAARCTLEDVNDRGVVISHMGSTHFHPWNNVVSLRLR